MSAEFQSVNISRRRAFFISNASFNPSSVMINVFLNWATNVSKVLLNTYKHYHHDKTFSIFTISVFMSRSRSIYVVSIWSIYLCDIFIVVSIDLFLIFIFILINRIFHECRHACPFAFFVEYVLEYVLLFLDDKLDEEYEEFPNSNIPASGCCLAFVEFFASFSLALLIKLWLMKKCVESIAVCRTWT